MLKKCIICGKEFETNYKIQKCCSPECSKENTRRYNKLYYQVYPEKYQETQQKWRNSIVGYSAYHHHYTKAKFLDYNIESAWTSFDKGNITYDQLCKIEGRYIETAGYLGMC